MQFSQNHIANYGESFKAQQASLSGHLMTLENLVQYQGKLMMQP